MNYRFLVAAFGIGTLAVGAHAHRLLRRSACGPERCQRVAKAAERIAARVVVGVIASGSIFT